MLAAIGLFGSVAAQTSAPDARISLNLQNVPLKEVFSRIEDQSNYIFVYYDNILDASRRVSISVSDQTVGDVLEVLFAGTENTWKLSGRQIVIGKAAAVGKTEKQATLRVMGSVKDHSGEPLIGVTVFVKERPNIGTATDINGNYLIDVLPDDVLEFSYVGYKTQDVAVAGRGLLDVVLEQNDALLDAVEVVGYGVQKKISVIGSQQSIQVDELKVPAANLTQGLAGRVAGLVSVQRTSEPGFDDADIYIRGISTLTASMSAPLTLVDGVPRSFANVDPEDIESFSILKDASATAVYGVRGANGVIIINTKSGLKGRPKFTVRYTEGITTPTKITDFVDGATYMEMSNEASTTRGGGTLYSREVIEKTRTHADPYLYPNVDWMDEILRDYSHNRSANVNVSGGSDKAVYYIGLAYYDEDGMYKDTKLADYNSNTYYRRYNVTTNLTLNPFRTTEIKLGIQGYLANANYPASSQATIFESAYFTQPTYIAPMYPDGKLGAFSGGGLNPVAELGATGYANQWRSQVYSNLRVTQQLCKGLSITGMFSFDTYNYTSNRFTKSPNTYHATGRDANGNLIYEQTRQGTENLAYSLSAKGDRTIYLEAALNYKNTFGRHDVSGMLLFNQSDEINTKATNVEEALPYRFRGLAGRFTYGFDDRYFAEFNFGYNGSENFAPKNRYGFFPSMGLGWVISNESFFEPLTGVIQYLKVRGTWGQVGNSQISGRRFAYLATVTDSSSPSYTFGKNMDQNFGTTAINEYAVDVTWEVADKTDIGVDMRLLNNKLNFQFDYFKESREGIYLRRSSIPAYVGMINNPYGNIGRVENKGVEFSINYANSWGDWSLSLMGNYSFNRNKVLEDDSTAAYPWQSTIGNKVGQRFGLVALGLFESYEEIAASPMQTGDTRPGDIKYKDVNGDGKIDEYDKVPIGWGSVPEIMYGFGFSIGWKNLSLTAMFQGAAHVDAMLSGEGVLPFSQGSSRGNLLSNITDRWTEQNPSQDVFYPRLSIGNINMNYETSTWWLKNTDYLRLKNIELSYRLPDRWMKRIHLDNARVFIQGVNLLTFSSFKIWDVELGDGRGARYPNIASVSLGVNFNF
ncbi:TonB-dependent receptor [uncultured Alistipes sp.]|uniref:TonB-dependent receptor n=1 Tax=uncultured Alistipes sp. TaxID=538949 RepID=UPI000E9AF374|nr:TonB-dependent receptor [uncultured Alistipes sp.]HBL69791.1 SusC/RagA family TonB-linked outer membrane protein [Alistipes sp.]HBW02164.1 SusC/RagA family TonB-linked outer membrane protein [Alistipes sp.]